jgi:methylated-DNA-protein-cysteine methyltransferase-like protein
MEKKLAYPVIWGLIQKVPVGKVATYGQIARLTGLNVNPRQVGYALKIVPESLDLPWFRIINSQGKISFAENSASFIRQKDHLLREGVRVIGAKINLTEYQWQP